jgi:GYF domain 2
MNSPTLWYYHKDGRGFGPVQEADIRGLLQHNEIAADTLVWRDGLSNWTEAQSTELSGFSSDAAPSPPRVSIVTPSRQKDSNAYWFAFILAEIFNGLTFGLIPLFTALVLSVGGTNSGH